MAYLENNHEEWISEYADIHSKTILGGTMTIVGCVVGK